MVISLLMSSFKLYLSAFPLNGFSVWLRIPFFTFDMNTIHLLTKFTLFLITCKCVHDTFCGMEGKNIMTYNCQCNEIHLLTQLIISLISRFKHNFRWHPIPMYISILLWNPDRSSIKLTQIYHKSLSSPFLCFKIMTRIGQNVIILNCFRASS